MIRSILAFALLHLPLYAAATTAPFINELHYDNAGVDAGEGVEIAGAAGTVLDGWSLLLYNGSNGSLYRTVELIGTIGNQSDGYGTVFFDTGSLQNGDPDGLALVDNDGFVQQFLSYEGVFMAMDGAAAGLTSLEIPLAESSDTLAGWSLGLVGSGVSYEDFVWSSGLHSYGAINTGQSFAVVPLPATLSLFACAIGLLCRSRRNHMNE
jgi:hypothetical protein